MLTQKRLILPFGGDADRLGRAIAAYLLSLEAPGSLVIEAASLTVNNAVVMDLSPAGSLTIPADNGVIVPDHFEIAAGQLARAPCWRSRNWAS